MAPAVSLLLGIAVTASSVVARAEAPPLPDGDPCRHADGDANHGAGPLPSGLAPADFGLVPEACPAFDVLAGLRGGLLVASDAPDFYGNVGGGLLLRVRRPLTQRSWLSLAMDALTYRYVANAVVASGAFSLGPPTFSLYHRLPWVTAAAVTVYGRALLPLDTAREHGVQLGGELGLASWIPIGPRHGLQGGLALPVPVDVTAGQAHGAFRPALLGEAFWLPRRWTSLALFAGAAVRSQVLPDRALTSVAARVSVQLASREGWRLALAAEIPLVGDDRTDAAVALMVTGTGQTRLARTAQIAILPRSHAQD